MNTIIEWFKIHSFLVYMGIWKHWHERVPICAWWIWAGWSKPLVCVHWCGSMCFLCMHFFKGESLLFLDPQSGGAHVWITGSRGHCLFSFKSINFLRDAVAGPILSLTKNYVWSLHSLDFGFCIQWSWFRSCILWCLLLLLTLCPCRFPFHRQVMILMRSYNRLASNHAIASVDGCFLYIIIHNSMPWRTKLKRSVH